MTFSEASDNEPSRRFITNEFESVDEVMPPPPLGGEYAEVKDLVQAVNEWTKGHSYALVIKNSRENRKGVKDTVYLCCTRGQKVRESRSRGTGKGFRKSSSRRIECPFQAVAKLEDGHWTLKRVNNETHNHKSGGKGSHFSVRRIFLDRPEVWNNIIL